MSTGVEEGSGRAIDLSFDPALLTFEGADFGSDMGFPCAPGDPNPACEATVTATDAAGTLTLVAVSFADLNPQPAGFDLATLKFSGLVPGSGAVTVFTDAFTELVVSDLGLPETLSLASFDLPPPSSGVTILPEPSSVLLLGLVLLALPACARRS